MPRNAEQRKHVFSLKSLSRLRQQSSNDSVIVKKENSQIPFHIQYQLRQELRNQTEGHDSVTIGNQKRKQRLQTIR